MEIPSKISTIGVIHRPQRQKRAPNIECSTINLAPTHHKRTLSSPTTRRANPT
jgi:hypothetical protein